MSLSEGQATMWSHGNDPSLQQGPRTSPFSTGAREESTSRVTNKNLS